MKARRPSDDESKIQETVLALLGALESENGRVWKRCNFAVMDVLHTKRLIIDPCGRAESVFLTQEGMRRAKELAAQRFDTNT